LLFFEFLSKTGLRIGEAIEVRWCDLELETRWLHVRRRLYDGKIGLPKGRKKRRIRISLGLARALRELHARTSPGDDDLVFTTAVHHKRIDPSNLMSRVLKPAAVAAGLGEWVGTGKARHAETWVGFHTFRHTCATRLFRHGWNPVQVQKFLGHSDPGFTLKTYVHLLPEDQPDPSFMDVLERSREETDYTAPAAIEIASGKQSA
jgi:integrase